MNLVEKAKDTAVEVSGIVADMQADLVKDAGEAAAVVFAQDVVQKVLAENADNYPTSYAIYHVESKSYLRFQSSSTAAAVDSPQFGSLFSRKRDAEKRLSHCIDGYLFPASGRGQMYGTFELHEVKFAFVSTTVAQGIRTLEGDD